MPGEETRIVDDGEEVGEEVGEEDDEDIEETCLDAWDFPGHKRAAAGGAKVLALKRRSRLISPSCSDLSVSSLGSLVAVSVRVCHGKDGKGEKGKGRI